MKVFIVYYFMRIISFTPLKMILHNITQYECQIILVFETHTSIDIPFVPSLNQFQHML